MDWSDRPAGQPAHSPPTGSPFAAPTGSPFAAPTGSPFAAPTGSPFAAPASFSPDAGFGSAPMAAPASPVVDRPPRLSGTRRTIATALLAVGLLTAGGVAVVFAADPAATPAPSATTTQPSAGTGNGNGIGTVPTRGARPQGAAGTHNGADCPNMDGSGGSTAPSGSATPTPATPATPVPATPVPATPVPTTDPTATPSAEL